jgi:hypothetical protein
VKRNIIISVIIGTLLAVGRTAGCRSYSIINACMDAATGHRARREENMSVGELVALGILVVIWIHSLLKN